MENYGRNGKFLFHAFSVFSPQKVINFFTSLGLKTKIERGKGVFPVSDDAKDVLKALVKYLEDNKANIIYDSEVTRIDSQNNRISKLMLRDKEIAAKNYIFCTGGRSYPATGSTGDGFNWAKSLGYIVIEPAPALVPIKIKESWVKDLRGLSLKNIDINVFQDKMEPHGFTPVVPILDAPLGRTSRTRRPIHPRVYTRGLLGAWIKKRKELGELGSACLRILV